MKGIEGFSRDAPVLLAGPTGSGKSALAMELAARDGRVIVNADALQVYDCWRVLSARPSATEEAALPHALYGHVGRDQDYSVGAWLREVAGLLDRRVVIVGGTGLYFRALTEGLAEIPPIPADIRAEADDLRLSGQVAVMRAALDAATAAKTDVHNPVRVQRAYEVQRATGQGLAAWQASTPAALLPICDVQTLVLQPSVPWLEARIAQRFSVMLEDGALDEVRAALPYWQPARPWARAIGAPELVAHLHGHMSLEAAKHAAILASRQYAKRQRTWFRTRMAAWSSAIPG
ncbi:MAG: tRNA (adenosine(37)-N6)-dimethylallyltransferase MiaA [Pseudomonadota bacterium]